MKNLKSQIRDNEALVPFYKYIECFEIEVPTVEEINKLREQAAGENVIILLKRTLMLLYKVSALPNMNLTVFGSVDHNNIEEHNFNKYNDLARHMPIGLYCFYRFSDDKELLRNIVESIDKIGVIMLATYNEKMVVEDV